MGDISNDDEALKLETKMENKRKIKLLMWIIVCVILLCGVITGIWFAID